MAYFNDKNVFTIVKVDKVADVEANPTDTATAELNKLKVDGTTYSVPTNTEVNNKVDKVTGKALSTNDYDNTEKSNVASNTMARHTHSNKSLLDTYDQTNANISDAVSKKHTHSNKSVLDGITSAKVTSWDNKQNELTSSSDVDIRTIFSLTEIRTGNRFEINYGQETPIFSHSGNNVEVGSTNDDLTLYDRNVVDGITLTEINNKANESDNAFTKNAQNKYVAKDDLLLNGNDIDGATDITLNGTLTSQSVETDGINVNGDVVADNLEARGDLDVGGTLNAETVSVDFTQVFDDNDNESLDTKLNSKVGANASITGATKTKITYDSKGLVTGGADLQASDIPNLSASKITSGTFADSRIASASVWNAKADESSVITLSSNVASLSNEISDVKTRTSTLELDVSVLKNQKLYRHQIFIQAGTWSTSTGSTGTTTRIIQFEIINNSPTSLAGSNANAVNTELIRLGITSSSNCIIAKLNYSTYCVRVFSYSARALCLQTLNGNTTSATWGSEYLQTLTGNYTCQDYVSEIK